MRFAVRGGATAALLCEANAADVAAAKRKGRSTTRLVASDPPATALVIDAEGVSDIDTTAIQQLEELLEDLAKADVDVAFARVRQPVTKMLERAGLDGHRVFLEVDDAVEHFVGDGT